MIITNKKRSGGAGISRLTFTEYFLDIFIHISGKGQIMKHLSPVLNEGINREILAVLDQYVKFYNEKNEEMIFSLFSKNVSGFGTEKEETVLNLAQFKERIRIDFNPANAIHMNVKVLATGGGMPVAWITGLCNYSGRISGKSIHMECRMTVVLANRGGRWLFEQVHFSLPGA